MLSRLTITSVSYAILLSIVGCAASAETLQFGRGDDGTLVRKESYKFPHKTYSEHLEWIENDGGGKNLRKRIEGLFNEKDYKRYRENRKVKGYEITYMSQGLKINGYLVTPGNNNKNLPLIIFNRGGVMKWGKIYHFQVLELYRIAERGYTVLASHYRGNSGSEGKEEMDGNTIADVLNLISLAERLPEADENRIGMLGFSRGGGLTYQVLKHTDRISAAIIRGGPVDHVTSHRRAEFDEFVYPFVVPGYKDDPDRALINISSIFWYEDMSPTTPVLLLHGGADWRVPSTDALRMATKLQELERPYRLKIYEGGSHGLFENYADVRVEVDRWFDRYVRDGVTAPKNRMVAPPPEELE